MYVCMYVCMYVRMYICTYVVCMYVCMYVNGQGHAAPKGECGYCVSGKVQLPVL